MAHVTCVSTPLKAFTSPGPRAGMSQAWPHDCSSAHRDVILEACTGHHLWCLSLGLRQPLSGPSRGHNSCFTAEEPEAGGLFQDAKKQCNFIFAPHHTITSGITTQQVRDWKIQGTVPRCFSQLLGPSLRAAPLSNHPVSHTSTLTQAYPTHCEAC